MKMTAEWLIIVTGLAKAVSKARCEEYIQLDGTTADQQENTFNEHNIFLIEIRVE